MRVAVCIVTVLAGLGLPAVRAEAAPAAITPRDVAAAARPYNDGPLSPRRAVGLVDRTGVRMFSHDVTGGRPRNHPVAQAQYGIMLLNTYRLKHDTWFLYRAELQAKRLIATRVESRGAWWYPYPFDYPLGANIGYTMRRPWYSAMAQGQVTSLFIRLAQATGESAYRIAADRSFLALRLGFSATLPWDTHRDGNNMLWLEEYPAITRTRSGRVLNGHMFAMYGIWDYWMVTRSTAAAALFADAAVTVKRYVLNNFRNPGWASNYALRGLTPIERYHTVHVSQLLHMQALTGDSSFATVAEVYQTDFPAPVQHAKVLLGATKHTGIRFADTTSGRVTGRLGISLTRPSVGAVSQRRRIGGQSGYWYLLISGTLRGLWVQEVPGVRATLGPVSTMPYLAPRTVGMAVGRYRVCTSIRCTVVRIGAPTGFRISSIGWIRGQRAVRLAGGRFINWWLPLTSRTNVR